MTQLTNKAFIQLGQSAHYVFDTFSVLKKQTLRAQKRGDSSAHDYLSTFLSLLKLHFLAT